MFIVVITLLLCVLVLEAGARLFYPLYADYNTEMWRYSAVLKKRSDLPGIPFEHVSDKKGTFYGVDIQTNDQGWRHPQSIPVDKKADEKRILVLGDSVALGWGVPYDKTFSHRLEERLSQTFQKPVSVLNTGVGNYNTAAEWSVYKRMLSYQPDVVVLLMIVNDAEMLTRPNVILEAMMKRSYLYGFLWGKMTLLKYYLGRGISYDQYYRSLYEEHAPGLEDFKKSLHGICGLAEAQGHRLIVVDVPELHRLDPYPFQEVTELKRKIVGRYKGVHYVDLLEEFSRYNPKELWVSPEDTHPNALGHQIMAEALAREIVHRLK